MNKNLGPLLLFLLTVSFTTHGQDSILVDSLNSSIPTLQTDYNINTVFDALQKSFEIMPRLQAFQAAQQSLEQARESGNPLSEIFAHRNLGKLYNSYGNKEEALKHFQ